MDHRGRELPEVGSDLNASRPAPHAPRPHPATPRTHFDFGHAYDPNRLQPATKPASREKRRLPIRTLAGLAFVALTTVAAYAAHRSGVLDRDQLATTIGFGIEQVSLTGHRFTSDADLFDALDLKSVRSLNSFDAGAIRRRFERLPWVQSVEISRVWPGQIAIRVVERRPFAIWERGETAELVDETGRVLGPIKLDAVLDLPRLSGDGANMVAADLFATLDRFPAIKARVVRAARHGDRRWTLELSDGGQIHLPADGEVSALTRLAAQPQLAANVLKPGQIIDLRSPSKIAIRAASVARIGGE
jgi:cell division protein FtsQ